MLHQITTIRTDREGPLTRALERHARTRLYDYPRGSLVLGEGVRFGHNLIIGLTPSYPARLTVKPRGVLLYGRLYTIPQILQWLQDLAVPLECVREIQSELFRIANCRIGNRSVTYAIRKRFRRLATRSIRVRMDPAGYVLPLP